MTGSLATAIRRAGVGEFGTDLHLRFTTKFDDVADLVGTPASKETLLGWYPNTKLEMDDAARSGPSSASSSTSTRGR